MPATTQLNIVLPDEVAAELRNLIQAGIASGPGIDADIVFAALRAEFSDRREG